LDYQRYRSIAVERQGPILRVTLNRPDALNAVNAQLHAELADVFFDVAADHEASVVVLTGAGRAFCAGGDLKWLQSIHGDAHAFSVVAWEGRRIIDGLLALEKPVIARVPGPAIGLGATLALFSDLIYAAESAQIGDPHVRVGLVAGDGGAVIWPQLIGYARAKEYLLTGDVLAAREAERIGLINHAVPDAELDKAVDAMAQRLAAGATKAIGWTKASINTGLRQLASAVMEGSLAREAMSAATADHKIGLDAFARKQKPRFTGR
jgi:enoyl-CoA hydratase